MTTSISRTYIAVMLTAICTIASAQRFHHYRAYVPGRVIHTNTTVFTRPRVCVDYNINNKFTKKDRCTMMIAFLKKNRLITAKEYSEITGLKKKVAEAELETFCDKYITPVDIKGKRYYTLKI